MGYGLMALRVVIVLGTTTALGVKKFSSDLRRHCALSKNDIVFVSYFYSDI